MPTCRLPHWIHTTLPTAAAVAEMRGKVYGKGLHTVCREARCPNQGECSAMGAASFLILGDKCTRNCSFCAVAHGKPAALDGAEADIVAASVAALHLRHVVITSVTRDDLPDGGASAFSQTVRAIRKVSNRTTIEGPDSRLSGFSRSSADSYRFQAGRHRAQPGDGPASGPWTSRHGSLYPRSLELLRRVGEWGGSIVTKSGIMVGVGETREEIMGVVRDLVDVQCAVLTIGQYLQPTHRHHSVHRFIPPQEFADLKEMAVAAGMKEVMAGPLVRSSFRAGQIVEKLRLSSALQRDRGSETRGLE